MVRRRIPPCLPRYWPRVHTAALCCAGGRPSTAANSGSEQDASPAPSDQEGESEEAGVSSEGEESDEEDDVGSEVWSEGSEEEDVYSLVNRAAGAAYARQLAQFPLISDWTPPPMQHELAGELR